MKRLAFCFFLFWFSFASSFIIIIRMNWLYPHIWVVNEMIKKNCNWIAVFVVVKVIIMINMNLSTPFFINLFLWKTVTICMKCLHRFDDYIEVWSVNCLVLYFIQIHYCLWLIIFILVAISENVCFSHQNFYLWKNFIIFFRETKIEQIFSQIKNRIFFLCLRDLTYRFLIGSSMMKFHNQNHFTFNYH